jgi:hypothetical protein
MKLTHSKTVVLMQGYSVPRGLLARSGDVLWERGATGVKWVQAKDAEGRSQDPE